MIRSVLLRAEATLRQAGVDDPRGDAERLLAALLGLERWQLRFAPAPAPELLQRFDEQVACRAQHTPLQYLTGRVEFYGLPFDVAPGVLIPRPETEGIVDAVRAAGTPPPRLLADIGTGSGVLAVTLAHAFPTARVIAIDISARALEIARHNAEKNKVGERVGFRHGSLLEPLAGDRPDVVVSNPPYVTTAEWAELAPEVRDHEPREALDGGADGLIAIREIVRQAAVRLAPGGGLFLEIGHQQAEAMRQMLADGATWERVRLHRDLGGIERVVEAWRVAPGV